MTPIRSSALAMAAPLLLTACAMPPVKPPEAIAETHSTTYPVRTLTGFTEGLVCMDKMFIARKVEPVYITAAPIPDYSESRGGAGYAARDMLISAIAEMGKESAALRFVAFDRQTPDIVALQSSHPKKGSLRIPDFFIRGAVTQINTSPYAKQRGASLNVGQVNDQIQGGGLSTSGSLTLASVSLDLAVGLVNNYQILPGVFSANTFSVEKRGSSDELSISLKKLGAVYSVSENSAEALSRALRVLVEVGAIELFGKLYNLPYWECLAAVGDAGPDRGKAQELYSRLDDRQRSDYLLDHLKALKMVAPDATVAQPDGRPTVEFRNGLMQYRVRHNVFGGTGVDFAIFERAWKDIELSHNMLAAQAMTQIPPTPSDAAVAQPKIINPKSNPAPSQMKTPAAPGTPVLPPPVGASPTGN